MRELEAKELIQVSGGFQGTRIPFSNRFVSGPNWPGGFPTAIAMIGFAWQAGQWAGKKLNRRIELQYGMSTGEAAFRTFGRG